MPIYKHGKNLFNINGDVNTRYNGTTGSYNSVNGNDLTSTIDAGDYHGFGQRIYVGAGNRVTLSVKLKSYAPSDLTGKVASISLYNDNTITGRVYVDIRAEDTKKTLSFTPTTDYIYATFGKLHGTSATFTNIQVEIGSTATSYEPYTEPKVRHIAVGSKNIFPLDILNLTPTRQQQIVVETIYDSDVKKRVLHLKDNGSYPTVECQFPQRLKRGAYYDIRIKYKAISLDSNDDFWMFPNWGTNPWDNLGAWDNGNSKKDISSDALYWRPTNGYVIKSKRFRVNEDRFDSEETSYTKFLFSLGYGNRDKEIWIADISLVEITEEEWEQTEFTPHPYEPYYNIARVYHGENLVFSDILPDELQEVEYLESSGTEYINTRWEVDHSKSPRVVANMYTSNGVYAETNNYALFGEWHASNQFRIFKASTVPYSNQLRVQLGGEAVNISGVDLQGVWHEYDFGINGLFIDGIDKEVPSVSWLRAPNTGVYIFASNSATSGLEWAGYNANIRVKDFKCYEDSTLVRDFIPCYVKTGQTFVDEKGNTCSAGTPGLYDLVNGVFYTNSGTGTFSVGRDV